MFLSLIGIGWASRLLAQRHTIYCPDNLIMINSGVLILFCALFTISAGVRVLIVGWSTDHMAANGTVRESRLPGCSCSSISLTAAQQTKGCWIVSESLVCLATLASVSVLFSVFCGSKDTNVEFRLKKNQQLHCELCLKTFHLSFSVQLRHLLYFSVFCGMESDLSKFSQRTEFSYERLSRWKQKWIA
jgi:hypothetical protein